MIKIQKYSPKLVERLWNGASFRVFSDVIRVLLVEYNKRSNWRANSQSECSLLWHIRNVIFVPKLICVVGLFVSEREENLCVQGCLWASEKRICARRAVCERARWESCTRRAVFTHKIHFSHAQNYGTNITCVPKWNVERASGMRICARRAVCERVRWESCTRRAVFAHKIHFSHAQNYVMYAQSCFYAQDTLFARSKLWHKYNSI